MAGEQFSQTEAGECRASLRFATKTEQSVAFPEFAAVCQPAA